MDQLLAEANLAAIRCDPALSAACHLRALTIVDGDGAGISEETRLAAARYLWSETATPRYFGLRLAQIADPATPEAQAMDAVDWCARRACGELHDRRIAAAAESRGPGFVAAMRRIARGPTPAGSGGVA